LVQTLPSSQLVGPPPTHAPPEHVSPEVQALPSLHATVLLVWVQPVDGLQESSVQGLPSSQFGPAPPTQTPPEHASPVVQALPSSQEAALLAYAQPVAGLQESSVQTLPSLQLVGPPLTQLPPEQASPVVQAFPSLHGAVLFAWEQPVTGLHESSVHGFPSSQFGPAPPMQTPPEQASPVVQALPSSQEAVLFVWAHPVAGTQESSVHGLPSLQLGPAPPTQTPPEQASPVVQALPSSHGAVLLACVQPVAGLQASSVHTLPSSQFGAAPPTQTPPEHVSPEVQALPSLHATVLLVWVQPVDGLQPSSVQGLPSSQLGPAPPTQLPPAQVSPVVHALPSLQAAVLLLCVQPVAGLQASSVHTLLSSQFVGPPGTHVPLEQASPVVHAFPSEQELVLSLV
jgi:hypothetical protein